MTCYDLHSHSTASDGMLEPAALVARAHGHGVEVLALTDHDTTAGVEAAAVKARELGVGLVPAVEISATWRRRTVHVVALGIEPGDPGLQGLLERLYASRWSRAEEMARRLKRCGMTGVYEGICEQARGGAIGRTHVARFLVAQGQVRDMAQAFRQYLGRGKAAYVAAAWPPLDEVVGVIRAAGGRAVLAHPASYRLTGTKLGELLEAFKAGGGTAMEVVRGNAPPREIELLAGKARYYGLLASQGSDFHDPNNPWVELGRLAPLPAGCTPLWEAPDWDKQAGAAAVGTRV